MIVTEQNAKQCLDEILFCLKQSPFASLDTETTGLNSFKGDRPFSVILATVDKAYYFNFKDYGDGTPVVPESIMQDFAPVWRAEITWFLQNAKFDLHMMHTLGVELEGKIFDTAFLDRIHFNQHMRYNLAEITKRWGNEKLDIVGNYISEHKLTSVVEHPELMKTEDRMHFDRVPASVIVPYGEQDAQATLDVGLKIWTEIVAEDAKIVDARIPKQTQVVDNESHLVKTLYKMEQVGVKLDVEYCNEALSFYRKIIQKAEKEFKEITGLDFVKGTTVFEEVFAPEKDKWEQTEKGNWKWDAKTLSRFENPAARIVTEYAEAKKQFEYFANFMFYRGHDDAVHPTFSQYGTVTGRLSSRDPNAQNWTNPDKYEDDAEASLFPVRKALIPREGFFFLMPDYSQVEFRIMVDKAYANRIINEILAGHDVHTATANVAGVSRKEAKTVNFLTAYGGGVVKLAQNLFATTGSHAQLGAIYKKMFGWRLSEEEQRALPTVTESIRSHNEPLIRKAYEIQQSIFRAAPEIKDFTKAVQDTAQSRGYVRNWLGRRYYFPDRRWAYKAPNHLIQGGAADVIKVAMNRIDKLLEGKKSRMLMQVHDEIVFELAYGEESLVPEIKGIMESVYPYNRLPLLVEVEYSKTNLADKEAWPG